MMAKKLTNAFLSLTLCKVDHGPHGCRLGLVFQVKLHSGCIEAAVSPFAYVIQILCVQYN